MGITSSTLGSDLDQAQQLPGNLIVSTVMANLGFERAWENKVVLIRTRRRTFKQKCSRLGNAVVNNRDIFSAIV